MSTLTAEAISITEKVVEKVLIVSRPAIIMVSHFPGDNAPVSMDLIELLATTISHISITLSAVSVTQANGLIKEVAIFMVSVTTRTLVKTAIKITTNLLLVMIEKLTRSVRTTVRTPVKGPTNLKVLVDIGTDFMDGVPDPGRALVLSKIAYSIFQP